jgi:hypothetical protein
MINQMQGGRAERAGILLLKSFLPGIGDGWMGWDGIGGAPYQIPRRAECWEHATIQEYHAEALNIPYYMNKLLLKHEVK